MEHVNGARAAAATAAVALPPLPPASATLERSADDEVFDAVVVEISRGGDAAAESRPFALPEDDGCGCALEYVVVVGGGARRRVELVEDLDAADFEDFP